MSDNSLADFKLWYYTPSLPLAVIATIIFICLTSYHTWRLIRTRKWFCIPLVIGGLFELIGYAARASAHNNTTRLMPYIIQSLLLLIAPPLFAATIYMTLSRIIRTTHAEHHSLIPVKWVTTIFVCSDVLCFFVQSGGGGIQAKGRDADTFKLGEHIILAGLILQIVIFAFFLVVAVVFHRRLLRSPTTEVLDNSVVPWRRLMWVLYTASVLITVRNVVRVVEYAMGSKGYLLTHEWTLYVFDGLLMACTMVVCLTWYGVDLLRAKPRSLEAFGLEQQNFTPKERV